MFQHPALKSLDEEIRRISHLSTGLRLLGWDQETYMPVRGAAARSQAMGALTKVVHRAATSPELGDLIAAAEAALDQESHPAAGAYLREVRRGFDRRQKIPTDLAETLARTSSEALQAWKQARESEDFSVFEPALQKLIDLKKESAGHHGYDEHPYDALLQDYEPDATTAEVEALCDAVKPGLVELVRQVKEPCARTSTDCLRGYDVAGQESFCREVIESMGFDFDRGRVDLSTHPFCSGLSPDDVRLTTRYSEEWLPQGLFGLIHEAGHGLYEQGLDSGWLGTPLGDSCSMGIHESQSRLWENNIARSPSFWRHQLPRLSRHFGRNGIDLDAFVRSVNVVTPSPIRVEADEVTYNLHIMLRFEIEKELFAPGSSLKAADLPALWNEKMQAFLDLTPANLNEGVLQDIHWSFGGFGYFPTYFLGNLYAAQFMEVASEKLGDLDAQVEAGELAPLTEWLRSEIHEHGSRYPAPDLCARLTGHALDPQPFLDYLTAKMQDLFA